MHILLSRFGFSMSPLMLLPLLAGCGTGSALTTAPTSAAVGGNWRFAASGAPASAAQVTALSGSLQVINGGDYAPSTVQGVVHTVALASQNAGALCVKPSQAISVTGSTAKDGTLTLTSASFGGGSVLTVRGSYDATARTLSNAQFGIAGGSCGFAMQPMIATQYQPISGTYTGTFASAGGGTPLTVTAQLTQTGAADANGNFSLSGTGSFQSNPCMASPVVTSSTVTGNAVTWTYTDPGTGAQVTASGSFDDTAATLTIASYTLSGGPAGCSDTGSGVLRR